MTTTTTDSEHPSPRFKFGPALFYFIGLIVFVFDQLSKLWIVYGSGLELGHYPPFGGFEIIPNVFNIVYATNEGAAWGILKGKSWLLISLAVLAVAFIFRYQKDLGIERRVNQIGLGLIIGGIFGNTLDRILFGHVIDFLDVHLQFYRWPTFNIADSGFVVGTAIFLITQFFDSNAKEDTIEN